MDWQTFTQLWGPAVPMFAVFVWYLHRLIFRTVPRGMSRLREAVLEVDRKANQRHLEALETISRVENAILEFLKSEKTKRARKPPSLKR